MTGQELGDGYQKAAGKQWNQQLGPSLALFDAGAAALKAAADPKDKAAVAKAIWHAEGRDAGRHARVGQGPGRQRRRRRRSSAASGSRREGGKYPLDFVLCENSADPNVPVAAKLKPYRHDGARRTG